MEKLDAAANCAPINGCATSPLMGPANQTRLVAVSESPRPTRKGVPYLYTHKNIWSAWKYHACVVVTHITYPSSTLHVICAPNMDTLKKMKSHVVRRVRPTGCGLPDRWPS